MRELVNRNLRISSNYHKTEDKHSNDNFDTFDTCTLT